MSNGSLWRSLLQRLLHEQRKEPEHPRGRRLFAEARTCLDDPEAQTDQSSLEQTRRARRLLQSFVSYVQERATATRPQVRRLVREVARALNQWRES